MDSSMKDLSYFHLFDSAGVGVAALNGENVVLEANDSFLRYLDLDSGEIMGKEVTVLKEVIVTSHFWRSIEARETFYCLVPGRNFLLLTTSRGYTSPSRPDIRRIILLRPYSLERDFIRMRSRLNQNIALEIRSQLNSVAIASEIILQPELQDNEGTKELFLSTFFENITDLGKSFNELQEVVEPIPFPNRVRAVDLDWRGLLTDLLAKVRGLASERNVSLVSDLSTNLPTARGDYHWLTLALYAVLDHLVAAAPPLGEVQVACHAAEGAIETTIRLAEFENSSPAAWPPTTLFPLPEDNPRISRMEFTDLALSHSIFRLHGGELLKGNEEGALTMRIRLPA